jgi:hypothetical protein
MALALLPVVQAMIIGGVLGLGLVAFLASAWLWVFGEPPAERACDCNECRYAAAEADRWEAWGGL